MLHTLTVVGGLLFSGGSYAWISPYVKNSETVPLIKVSIEPPANPYPQVTELRNKLERDRLKTEEAFFKTLEAASKKATADSKSELAQTVQNSLKIFQDKSTLDLIVKGAAHSLGSSTNKLRKNRFPAFEQIFSDSLDSSDISSDTTLRMDHDDQQTNDQQTNDDQNVLDEESAYPLRVNDSPEDGPLILDLQQPLSFLAVEKGIMDTLKTKLGNIGAPSINVQLLDVVSPDASLENKIRQLEQKRASLEKEMFDSAAGIFTKVVSLFINEVKKDLQIQIDSFLVDLKSIESSVGRLMGSGRSSFRFKEEFDSSSSVADNDTSHFEQLENLYIDDSDGPSILGSDVFQIPGATPLSFVAAGSAIDPDQLNVAVGGSDKPYPMIADVVDEMQKKRDATERLERTKILQMVSNLMRLQIEMLKDTLHAEFNKAVTSLGGVSSALKMAQ